MATILSAAPAAVVGTGASLAIVEWCLCGRLFTPKSVARLDDSTAIYTVDEATAARLSLPAGSIGAPIMDFCTLRGMNHRTRAAQDAGPTSTKRREAWEAQQAAAAKKK